MKKYLTFHLRTSENGFHILQTNGKAATDTLCQQIELNELLKANHSLATD